MSDSSPFPQSISNRYVRRTPQHCVEEEGTGGGKREGYIFKKECNRSTKCPAWYWTGLRALPITARLRYVRLSFYSKSTARTDEEAQAVENRNNLLKMVIENRCEVCLQRPAWRTHVGHMITTRAQCCRALFHRRTPRRQRRVRVAQARQPCLWTFAKSR